MAGQISWEKVRYGNGEVWNMERGERRKTTVRKEERKANNPRGEIKSE